MLKIFIFQTYKLILYNKAQTMIFVKDNKFYHETDIRIRYAETDKMGYSYYGNYPTFFEVGRTEFLREMGISYKELEDLGYMLPITSLSIKYLKPAIYDDLITVRTFLKYLHPIRVEFDYEIFNQKGELLTTGNTLLVFISSKTRRPTKAPDFYNETIKKFSKNLF